MGSCYCCGKPGKSTQIRQGMHVCLCETCKGAKITKSGFVCPVHGKQKAVEVGEIPILYQVNKKKGGVVVGKRWVVVKDYDEVV